MTAVRTSDLVQAAGMAGEAVFAFNVITVEHAEGIVAGAEAAETAVILQLSENTVGFHGGRLAPLLAACAALAATSHVPLALHLDHFTDPSLIATALAGAADFGVSSIMVDAAHLPYEANVERTREWSTAAHAAGLWVEAELGEIGGKKGAHAAGARTDPDEAADFVRRTGVDALAVAVGSSHAMATRDADVDIALTAALAAAVPVPLVLHGGSGVSDELLNAVVRAGVRKLNVGTALNIAFTAAVRDHLGRHPDGNDPRGYLAAGRDAVAEAVTRLCRAVKPESATR
ncbi:fructose-bisphosphate aldolase [Mycolicibacterium litorale]|nr:fructose-bisphosphate aldolase [Mycolicibacterium litorale]